MMENAKQSYVVVTESRQTVAWLEEALGDAGEVISTGSLDVDRVAQLVDVTRADLVFLELSLNPERLPRERDMLGALLVAKPMLPVIALGENDARELILTALRAGASDYTVACGDPEELRQLVHRITDQGGRGGRRGGDGSDDDSTVTVIAGARTDNDAPLLATQLAVALQRQSDVPGSVLLLDLGMPADDCGEILGLQRQYTLIDAVRNVRGLDRVLIRTAFPAHSSGVHVLGLGKHAAGLAELTSSDLYLFLDALKHYFDHIVVNLGGVVEPDFLSLFARRAQHLLLVVDQTVLSCRANRQLLDAVLERHDVQDRVGLVVDRYDRRALPTAETLAEGFGLPLRAVLPLSREVRLNVINSGKSFFELAPKGRYARVVQELSGFVAGQRRNAKGSWLARLGLAPAAKPIAAQES